MRNKKVHLQYIVSCRFQDKIYFLNQGFNGLFALNLDNFSVEYKKRIPCLTDGQARELYGRASCSYGNKIYFFFMNNEKILIYDVKTDDIQWFSLLGKRHLDNFVIVGIIKWKEFVWVFPMDLTQGILVFNLETLEVKEDLGLHEIANNLGFVNGIVQLDETEVAVWTKNNRVISIDIDKKQRMSWRCFKENLNVCKMIYDGTKFWILQTDSTDIYEWNPIEDQMIKYRLSDEEWITEVSVPYSNIVFWDRHIIVLPGRLKNILKIDKEAKVISKMVEYPKNFRFLKNYGGIAGWSAFWIFDTIDNKILLHPAIGNMLLVYDMENNYFEGKELYVTNETFPFYQEVIRQEIPSNGRFLEVEETETIEVLKALIDRDTKNSIGECTNKIGKEIYHSMNQK